MPVISRNVPAFTNDDCGGGRPGSNANDANYDTTWATCNGTPSAANAKWLAYDLSGVPASNRANVVVGWFNDPITTAFDHVLIGDNAYNNLGAYTIDVNDAAGGGSPPTTGWATKVSVANNTFNSRQHLLTGLTSNWIRIRITASDGSAGNTGVAVNVDVHDASAGASDDWMFYGDSITQDGFGHDTRVAKSGAQVGTFAQLVNARKPTYFPLYQDGGIGGLMSRDGASHIAGWLANFPGRYVCLAYGTNDALQGIAPATYRTNLESMVEAVLDAGKTPIVPTIPWGANADLRANVPALNDQIRALYAANPRVVPGPDLYALFNGDHSLISSDGVHPTWDAGYAALRTAWADWAASAIYP